MRMLTRRSLLHMIRPMMLPQTPSILDRMAKQVDKLDRRDPNIVNGKNIFFRGLLSEARGLQSADKVLQRGFAKFVLKGHHKLSRALSRGTRRNYTEQANAERDCMRKSIVGEYGGLFPAWRSEWPCPLP